MTISNKRVQLVNPWTGTHVRSVSWAALVQWADSRVHEASRKEWLQEARQAFNADDGETLGRMILGS